MAIIVESNNFKGSLLELLGKTKEQVMTNYSRPVARIDGEKAERLIWCESAREGWDGPAFPIFLMARVYEGKVWAVGIRADRCLFHVEFDGQGRPYLAAVAKEEGRYDPETVNWMGNKEGRIYDIGVSY